MAEVFKPERVVTKTLNTIKELKSIVPKDLHTVLGNMEIYLELLPSEVRECRIYELITDMMTLSALFHMFERDVDVKSFPETMVSKYVDLEIDLRNALKEIAMVAADYINENCIKPEKRKLL